MNISTTDLSRIEGRVLTILEAVGVIQKSQSFVNTSANPELHQYSLGNSQSDAIKHLIREAIWRDIPLETK